MDAVQEMLVAQQLDHPHILKLLDAGIYNRRASLVFELAEQSLRGLIHKQGALEEDLVLILSESMAKGLNHMHQLQIAHRDVNPNNVLLFRQNMAKLGDFGACACLKEGLAHELRSEGPRTTVPYRAPEIIFGGEPTLAVDIWALGCCFVEMRQGKALFVASTEVDLRFEMFNLLGVKALCRSKL